jgi:hypothetical protein
MYEIDKQQLAALKQAGLQGTPFKVAIGSKGIEHGFMGGVRDKAAVTEGGLTPNLLPPIQQLGPGGFWGLPYELTRVANFLPNVAMDGPGIAYFKHTANATEAGYVAEGALKPDITPTMTETYVRRKDPPDRGHRRAFTVAVLKVTGDRGRAGLMPVAFEVLAQRDDLVLDVFGGAARAVKWSS